MAVFNIVKNICIGDVVTDLLPFVYPSGGTDYYTVIDSPDSNVLFIYNESGGGQFGGAILSGGTLTTDYEFTINQFEGAIQTNTYNFILTITECDKEYVSACCVGDRTLVWLDIFGGVNSYLFSAKNNLTLVQKTSGTYKTANLELRHISKQDVYSGVEISQSGIAIEHSGIISSLRASIQAWEEIEGNFRPIILNADSFIYRPREGGVMEVNFDYRYSNELVIQTH
jgi:predicted outer membrane repeat protein